MLNKLYVRRVILGLSVAASVVLPAIASADALADFKQFAAKTQSAKGSFEQVSKGAGTAATKQSSGTFTFMRPGRFTWNYTQPYEQILQADGKKLYIYDKDLNQVTVRTLGNALGASPAEILFGSNDLDKNFILKDGGTQDGLSWLVATPRHKDTTFSQIRIALMNGTPYKMELKDAFGQTSYLTFTTFDQNPAGLTAAQFNFTVPKGADVFEQ